MTRWQILKILIISVSLYFTYTLTKSLLELYQARDRVTTQEKLLEVAKEKNEDLKQKLEEVRSVEYLEKEARENLNMQLPGETVVMIPSGKSEKKRMEERKAIEEPNWKKWARLIF